MNRTSLTKYSLTLIALSYSYVGHTQNYSCESASSLHQKKMEKYGMPDMPSLLEDCGIQDMLKGLGGDVFGGLIGKLGGGKLFCGYSAQDVGGWYGADIPNDVGVQYGIDVNLNDALLGNDPLFEIK